MRVYATVRARNARAAARIYPNPPNRFAFTTATAHSVQETSAAPLTLGVGGEPFDCADFTAPGSGGMLAAPVPTTMAPLDRRIASTCSLTAPRGTGVQSRAGSHVPRMQAMSLDRYSTLLLRLALLGVLAGWLPACSDCDLSVKTTSLPNGVVGVSYRAQLYSHCGGDIWFIQAGNLAPGIGLNDDGDLQGVPTRSGIYTFTVGVFDFGSGETAYQGLAIQVDPAA